MKRQSSQSSHNSKHGALSPGSVGESNPQPLRHHVKPAKRGHKVRLPQNHGSGRNLVKLAQQAQTQHAAEERERRKNSREKSRESDTEIRLPGSLDEHRLARYRNLLGTGTQLPRNTSHTKLKKNLSHGQLTKLGLGTTAIKGPPSPGLKSRNKRPRSADMVPAAEKDLHEQEVELAQQAQEKKDVPKKVGFAVGSYGEDASEGEDSPQMEGSGLQDDEWTDQSGSASPYSTRQNTANSSRRASMVVDKPMPDTPGLPDSTDSKDQLEAQHAQPVSQEGTVEADDSSVGSSESDEEDEEGEEEDEDEALSPGSLPQLKKENQTQPAQQPAESKQPQRSLLQAAREHPNPAARRLLSRNYQTAAPALVSNVSALDDARSGRGSPAPSMTSAHIVDGAADHDSGELVSRFMSTTSHPSTRSVPNPNTLNTPKTGSLQTPESDSVLAAQKRDKPSPSFGIGSLSKPSTGFGTGSKSPSTPYTLSLSRFRNEERMMNEKVIAEKEDAAAFNPIVPPHVFDRRNESLKSYLNLASLGGDGRGGLNATTGLPMGNLAMGPEIFQGRFKAVNTELKVVQRFRDPITESVARLHQVNKAYRDFAKLRNRKATPPPQKQDAKVPISKSAISLPKQASKLSSSASPPKSESPVTRSAITSAKSTTQIKRQGSSWRGKVTLSGMAPETREVERDQGDAKGADEVARKLWESIVP